VGEVVLGLSVVHSSAGEGWSVGHAASIHSRGRLQLKNGAALTGELGQNRLQLFGVDGDLNRLGRAGFWDHNLGPVEYTIE